MMSRTLGAPLGGTTRGGHQGFDCLTVSSIEPPNCGGGGGSCFPLMVVVALGEPETPVVCCCVVCCVVPNATLIGLTCSPSRRDTQPTANKTATALTTS